MKTNKVLAATFAATFLVNANADLVEPQTEAQSAPEEVSADDTTAPECECEESPFGGFFLGAGLGGSFMKAKVNGAISHKKDGDWKEANKSKSANNFMGSLFIGAGKVFNNKWWLGGVAGVNISKNKTWKLEKIDCQKATGQTSWANVTGEQKLKVNGVTPYLGLQFGGIVNLRTKVYLEAGVAFPNSKYFFDGKHDTDSKKSVSVTVKNSKAAPYLGIGAERACTSKFGAGVFASYQFRTKKKKGAENTVAPDGRYARFQNKLDGWNVRAYVTYNVKI